MDKLQIEQVIVGKDGKTTTAEIKTEIKSEPIVVPLQSYQHESLQCFQCFITFNNPKAKERHMRKSHREQYKQQLEQTDTLFTCYKCDKSFSSSEEVSLHQVVHNEEEKPFPCAFCKESFGSLPELSKHRRVECKRRRCSCPDCGALFACPSRLRSHRITVHLGCAVISEFNTIQCFKCGCDFKNEEKLLQHHQEFANYLNCDINRPKKKRGRKSKNSALEEAVGEETHKECNDSTTEGSSSVELKIPCPESNCDCIFPSVAALRAHKKTEHQSVLKTPSVVHTCLTCATSFLTESALIAHLPCDIKYDEAVEKR